MVKRLKLKATIMIKRNKFGGFTFIELLIAMAIVMIIATIAIPSLRERRVSANEDVATQVLLKDAQFLEKWNTLRGHYSNKDDKSGCPNLPYRFSPESADISSAKYYLNGKHKGSSLNENSCTGNAFTIKAIPICNRGQEGKKSVSLEHDGNIIRGVNPACIDETDIPPDEGNAIDDDNEDGDLNPPFDDETDMVDYCSKNPSVQACNNKKFCEDHAADEHKLPQCKCFLHGSLPECQKEPTDCATRGYSIECYCWFGGNPADPKCNDISPNFCTDVMKLPPAECNPPPDEDPCADPKSDKCTCSNPANSCLTLCGGKGCGGGDDPDPTPDQYDTESKIVDATCGNEYQCIAPTLCNSKDIQYGPNGTNGAKAWKLVYCTYLGAKPNYVSGQSYKKQDAPVITQSCNKYRCDPDTGANCDAIPSGISGGGWIQCYSGICSNPKVPPSPYVKTYSVILDQKCNDKRYTCENDVFCNMEGQAPGTTGKDVWSGK